MENTEFYRRLRYALSLDDQDTHQLFVALASDRSGVVTPDPATISAWRQRVDDSGHVAMTAVSLRDFVDALILHYRGSRTEADATVATSRPAPPANTSYDNNAMLKGVRVALALQVDDIVDCIDAGGGSLGKAAVSAFFRKPGNRNYRACGDQVLRQFLKGLALRRRGSAQ